VVIFFILFVSCRSYRWGGDQATKQHQGRRCVGIFLSFHTLIGILRRWWIWI